MASYVDPWANYKHIWYGCKSQIPTTFIGGAAKVNPIRVNKRLLSRVEPIHCVWGYKKALSLSMILIYILLILLFYGTPTRRVYVCSTYRKSIKLNVGRKHFICISIGFSIDNNNTAIRDSNIYIDEPFLGQTTDRQRRKGRRIFIGEGLG